jgi:hypothetical protein
VWAFAADTPYQWPLAALTVALLLASSVVKYLIPGKRLTAAGVPGRSITAGGILGVVGFFVIPVVGLFVGFIGGILAAERVRLGAFDQAWPSTLAAMKAVGLSILLELFAGLLMVGAWATAVVAS